MFLRGSSRRRPLSRRRRPRSLARIGQFPPYAQSPSIANRQKKKSKSIPLFLLTKKAQKKKLPKRKRRKKISRSAECLPSLGDADTHAPRMCQFPPLSVDDTAFPKRRAKTLFWRSKNKVKTQSLLNTVKNSSKGEKINESYI